MPKQKQLKGGRGRAFLSLPAAADLKHSRGAKKGGVYDVFLDVFPDAVWDTAEEALINTREAIRRIIFLVANHNRDKLII